MIERGLAGTAGVLLAASLLTACSAEGKKDQPTTGDGGVTPVHATRSEGVINGTLLYSTEPRPGHLVEFYDFGNGATAVHESFPMDIGGAGIMEDQPDPEDLASVFRLLNPKASVIPGEILAADARAKQAAADRVRVAAENAKLGAPVVEPAVSQAAAPRESTAAPTLLAAGSSCSSDVFGDNWGEAWFYDHVCNERNIRICHTNRFTDSYNGKSSSLRYKQLEGDFNVAGHMTGTHSTQNCCIVIFCDCGLTVHTDFDLAVAPRHVEMFTYTTSALFRTITASSPCGHAFTAALHN